MNISKVLPKDYSWLYGVDYAALVYSCPPAAYNIKEWQGAGLASAKFSELQTCSDRRRGRIMWSLDAADALQCCAKKRTSRWVLFLGENYFRDWKGYQCKKINMLLFVVGFCLSGLLLAPVLSAGEQAGADTCRRRPWFCSSGL